MGRLNKMKFGFEILVFATVCYICFVMRQELFGVQFNDFSALKIHHRNSQVGWFEKQKNQSNDIVLQNNQSNYIVLQNNQSNDMEDKEGGPFRPVHKQYYFHHGEWIKKPLHVNGKNTFKYFYIFSASVCNSSGTSVWDELRIYGQWLKDFAIESRKRTQCCIKYMDGVINTAKPRNGMQNNYNTNLPLFYFVFNIPRRNDTNLPTEVAIVPGNTTCSDNDVPYIKPFYPQREPGKLGISPKIAYGNLSSEAIIEWVEAMKHLGVDKIITYADGSLNEAALKTLQYYERTGLVEVFLYNQPAKDISPRNPEQKNNQKFEDARVVTYDAFERLRGYTYFAIIDMDEFLIPSKGRSLKQLMGDLLLIGKKRKKKIAGFYFKSVYFIKTWGIVNTSSDLDIGKYLNKTDWKPSFDRKKAIVINDNIQLYKDTHVVLPKKGYTMIHCSENEAYIRHYRSCRREWMVKNKCMDTFKRVTTYEVIKWVNKNIAAGVRRVRHELFGF